jgi:acyl-CoA thioester hydrolase
MTPKKFSEYHVVVQEDIDELKHVNNIVYLQLLQDLAIKHWSAIAPVEITNSLKWVVKKHEIEYFFQAGLGDKLQLVTWIETLAGATSIRRYEVYSDEKLVVKASTLWVAIHPETMKPVRIPSRQLECYFFDV